MCLYYEIMAKRKAAVNDIIYELDNDDIEISSEDEAKANKIKHFETKSPSGVSLRQQIIDLNTDDDIVNSSIEDSCNTESENSNHNGGKNSPDVMVIENNEDIIDGDELDCTITALDDRLQKSNADGPQTIILNEDIAIDSPASSNGIRVGGCDSKTPLITVHFKTNKLANLYKDKIKSFIVELLKYDDNIDLESENGLDLEIWPEDLNEFKLKTQSIDIADSLFFIDTDPNEDAKNDVPKYTHASTLISNMEQEEPEPLIIRRGPICFNCDGNHYLRDCPLPRNNTRIMEKRKTITSKHGRYHVEDEQKYGHLIPGRISSQLRHALGLKRNELPLHIYRMRMLGYPPGWLEEARISHSGIAMFDSAGNPILNDDDEEGEICEVGSKDKFDIKKILDFPGFNVPASSRYKEESHKLGMPPMSEQDSKLLMLQTLAPNAMKAYKRKKLTFFPSSTPDNSLQNSQAEMELDSGDEIAGFPSVPPLPDEAPPPPPPPPPPPDSLPPQSPRKDDAKSHKKILEQNVLKVSEDIKRTVDNEQDEISKNKMVSVTKMADIPVIDDDDLIVIDEYFEYKSQCGSGRSSPSLDVLEQKKKILLDALQKGTSSNAALEIKDQVSEDEPCIIEGNKKVEGEEDKKVVDGQDKRVINEDDKESEVVSTSEGIPSIVEEQQVSTNDILSESPNLDTSSSKMKTGFVKTTLYGTPVLNIASPYSKLPSDDKFAKDICDVINFENLPNSTGNYKKICTLLKKVKSEVDRIQES